LVIGAHTFCLLFLRRQWSDLISYIVLILAWALLLLVLSIENFVLAQPKEKGPYYGISVCGYWCWVTSAYKIEEYVTDYLFMLTSVAFSFIFYFLIFFRLRGNISLSPGYKISFHRRSKVRVGRTSGGAYIVTDDRRIEPYLITVAKHMLWYPFVYAVLVIPQTISRYPTFSGVKIPTSFIFVAAALFTLHGFLNTVLFCTTRNILPGNWRQGFGLGVMREGERGDASLSGRTNGTNAKGSFTGARKGSFSTGLPVLSVDVAEDVEVKYDTEPSLPYVGSASPTSPNSSMSPFSPTPLPRAYDSGGQRAESYGRHIRQISSMAC
jgi:hypothetical protein